MNVSDAAIDQIEHPIQCDRDIVTARQSGRSMAAKLAFSRPDQALIATAISELARNIVKYAGQGRVALHQVARAGRSGITIVAHDDGPGIPDIEAAMNDGFSTGNSLGLGLPGTRRIVDEFDIQSAPGAGVTITVTKWR